MREQHPKTLKEVKELIVLATESNMNIKFYEGEPSGKMGYSSAAEIYSTMTPTQMWHELYKKLQNKGIEVYRAEYEAAKEYYTLIKK